MSARNVAIDIEVGKHVEWHIFGVSLHGDTIISTLVAGGIIIALGLWVRRKISARQPSRVQIAFETGGQPQQRRRFERHGRAA